MRLPVISSSTPLISALISTLSFTAAIPTTQNPSVQQRNNAPSSEPQADRRWISATDLEKFERRHVLPPSRYSPRSSSGKEGWVWVRDLLSSIIGSTELDGFGSEGGKGTEGKVIFATTEIAEETMGGGTLSPTPGVGGGNGQAFMVEVTESDSQIMSPAGMVTEKCLTLVSDPSQKYCQTLLDGVDIGSDGGIPVSSAPNSITASSAVAVSSSASSSSADSGVASTTSTTSSATDATTVSASTATPTASATGNDTASSTDLTSVFGAESAISSSTTSASDSSSPSATATDESALDGTSSTSSLITASSTGSVVAAQAAASTSAVVIPGRTLQVLPIGLGIFGGLAGLTMIIVGYVLYERRKYKLQFRKRKLAEKGAPMGSS